MLMELELRCRLRPAQRYPLSAESEGQSAVA
jgi:hypothetical protein